MGYADITPDSFFSEEQKWKEEFQELRTIILDCGLDEDIKWGKPTYTWENRNIVLIHGFKHYCAILFPKGVLLKDEMGILVQQTVNVQAARQVRFTSTDEIVEMEPVLRAYIKEAVKVEKAGQYVPMKETSEYDVPAEFKEKLDEMPALKTAFEALTPGRQRGYLLFFAAPKLSKTRTARVEKYTRQIFAGKGLNDR
jgi:uncharacterized protein YdeI (YjbR/CyaY-like superfamily)